MDNALNINLPMNFIITLCIIIFICNIYKIFIENNTKLKSMWWRNNQH